MSTSGKSNKAKYKFTRNRPQYSKNVLDVDLKGFLCSCNNREKDCVRESYNILNKYADELYPISTGAKHCVPDETDDIEEGLEKEISMLKERKSRFQSLSSGAKNLIFISTTCDDPADLAHKIITDIQEKKLQQTRFLIRLVPIHITCRAHLKNIEKAFEPLVEKYFKNEAKTFSVVFNHRMNDSLSRDEVVKMIADKVMTARDDHKVDLKYADVSVVIEIIKSMALIGIVPNYLGYKKYNLLVASDAVQGSNEVNSSVDESSTLKTQVEGE